MNWFIEWIEEWCQLGPDYNWRTFHLIQIEIEDDRLMGGIEATIIVIGLGFRLRVNYMVTEHAQEIMDSVAEIKRDLSIK